MWWKGSKRSLVDEELMELVWQEDERLARWILMVGVSERKRRGRS